MLDFPFAPGPDGTAPAEFGALRADHPVVRVRLPDDTEAWLVTRYDDVVTVLTDPRFSRQRAAQSPGVGFGRSQQTGLLDLDPPEHQRLRRPLDRALSPDRVTRWRPWLERVVDELIDDLCAGPEPVDLVAAFAAPYAGRIICGMVGLPPESWRQITQWVEQRVSADRFGPEVISAANAGIAEALATLVARRRAQPAEDIASDLLSPDHVDGPLSDDEAQLVLSGLLMSGYIGNRNALARHVFGLLTHPAAASRLRSEPALMPTAVEELLRYYPSSNDGLVRVTTAEVTLSGTTLPAGATVMPLVASAGMDSGVFAQPAVLDVTRTPNPHLSLGRGPHACPGAHVVRAQFAVALGKLLGRLPHLRLAVAAHQVAHTTDLLPLGIRELPVFFRPPAPAGARPGAPA